MRYRHPAFVRTVLTTAGLSLLSLTGCGDPAAAELAVAMAEPPPLILTDLAAAAPDVAASPTATVAPAAPADSQTLDELLADLASSPGAPPEPVEQASAPQMAQAEAPPPSTRTTAPLVPPNAADDAAETPRRAPKFQTWSAPVLPAAPPAKSVPTPKPTPLAQPAPVLAQSAPADRQPAVPAASATPAVPAKAAPPPAPILPAGAKPRLIYRVVSDEPAATVTAADRDRGRVWQPPEKVRLCLIDAIVRIRGGRCPICHDPLPALPLANPDPQLCPVDKNPIREPHFGMIRKRPFVFCTATCAPTMAGDPDRYLPATPPRAIAPAHR